MASLELQTDDIRRMVFMINSEVKFLFVVNGGENIVTKYCGWQTNNLKKERP
jgi:hypothetical protein